MNETSPIALATTPKPATQSRLFEVAQELEVTFLTEFLKHAGPTNASEGFGGGIGEEQFQSFLYQEQARLMVEGGGIGLAETIFASLKKDVPDETG